MVESYTIKVDISRKESKFDKELKIKPKTFCKKFALDLIDLDLCERIYQFNIDDGFLFWIFLNDMNTKLNDEIRCQLANLKRRLNININCNLYDVKDMRELEKDLDSMTLNRIVYTK